MFVTFCDNQDNLRAIPDSLCRWLVLAAVRLSLRQSLPGSHELFPHTSLPVSLALLWLAMRGHRLVVGSGMLYEALPFQVWSGF